MRQKNTLCDHDYGNRPTDITAMTPNVPQSEVIDHDDANLKGNSEHFQDVDVVPESVAGATVNHGDIYFTEDDLQQVQRRTAQSIVVAESGDGNQGS
ncbi:Hypothetical predicted protein, partial [Olea europaea subsp. europaea]